MKALVVSIAILLLLTSCGHSFMLNAEFAARAARHTCHAPDESVLLDARHWRLKACPEFQLDDALMSLGVGTEVCINARVYKRQGDFFVDNGWWATRAQFVAVPGAGSDSKMHSENGTVALHRLLKHGESQNVVQQRRELCGQLRSAAKQVVSLQQRRVRDCPERSVEQAIADTLGPQAKVYVTGYYAFTAISERGSLQIDVDVVAGDEQASVSSKNYTRREWCRENIE